MNGTVWITFSGIAALTLIVLFVKPTDPTLALIVTAIAGLAGFHLSRANKTPAA